MQAMASHFHSSLALKTLRDCHELAVIWWNFPPPSKNKRGLCPKEFTIWISDQKWRKGCYQKCSDYTWKLFSHSQTFVSRNLLSVLESSTMNFNKWFFSSDSSNFSKNNELITHILIIILATTVWIFIHNQWFWLQVVEYIYVVLWVAYWRLTDAN